MEPNELYNDFFKNYRGRYSSYWIERFGLIPELPTSYDNANSIYELIAWLQRAFKVLLDDFKALESELEDFKNALIDLLEYLIPELIRRYHKSEEFRRAFIQLLKDILEGEEREWFKNLIKELMKEPDFRTFMKEYIKDLLDDPDMIQFFKDYISGLLDDPTFLDKMREKLGINKLENALMKIINNLEGSGAWTGGLTGNFNPERNIATGNINLFGGTPDGNSFIRTNSGQTENDLAGGI